MRKRFTIAVMAGVAMLWMNAANAAAMHASANLICSGCHTMHDSENSSDVGAAGAQKKLLKEATTTNLCLTCHSASLGTAPDVWAGNLAGGNFSNVGADMTKGHNPVSTLAGYTIVADTNHGVDAPGNKTGGADGVAVSPASFGCADCHDPHGTPANVVTGGYRILKAQPGGNTAVAGSVNGSVEANLGAAYSTTNYNVYKGTFGDWCSSCHETFHGAVNTDTDVGDSADWIRHPTDTALGGLNANYTAYDIAKPVIDVGMGLDGTTNAAASNPGATDKVFCLTCHQAHATINANATRWDNSAASGAGTKCNLCHAK